MTRNLCLLGLLAAVGCAGSSSVAPTSPAEVAGAQPASSPKYAILVPNMT
jgi:hypothetical protein